VTVIPAGPAWAEHRTRFAVEVVADDHSGWYAPVGETVARLIVDDLAVGLIGHDAAEPRRLRYRPKAGRHPVGPHARQALSAVEMACQDLQSNVTGRPVTDLLGGTVRRMVPAYASAVGLDPTHTDAAAAARWMAETGFWGQKWPLPKRVLQDGPAAVAKMLAPLREAAGGHRFMVDALGRCRVDDAIRLVPVLTDLDVTFAEELLPPNSAGWPRLRAAAPTLSLAAGEHAVDDTDQIGLLTGNTIDVWQIDPAWGGGLQRALHTVDVAHGLGMPTFPHGSSLPAAVAVAGACCRDMIPAVEWHLVLQPHRNAVHEEPVERVGGMLPVRDKPGLAGLPRLEGGPPAWEVTA
jgi:L-alanine-DL-glutamate epimerase-like enolase superfamily enzyme